MAYQTGTAADPIALLDAVSAFAAAQGWTVTAVSSTATNKSVLLTNAAVTTCNWLVTANISTSADSAYIEIKPATGWSGTAQTGAAPNAARTNGLIGPFTSHHFFTDAGGTYLHAAVEISSGVYAHLGLGVIAKAGGFTGGEYAYGTWWYSSGPYAYAPDSSAHLFPFDGYSTSYTYPSLMRVDADGAASNWIRFGRAVTSYLRGVRVSSLIGDGVLAVANAFNGVAPLLPILITGGRPGGGMAIYGRPPDMRFLDMSHFVHQEILALGSDAWMIFPVKQMGITTGQPSSGAYGIAYRKIA